MKFKILPKKLISKMWRPEPDDSSRSDFFRFERNERTSLFKEKEFNEILLEDGYVSFFNYLKLKEFVRLIAM